MLITVSRTETVSCDHNWKQTHRWTFQVYLNIIQNVQLKSKLPVGKTWKRLCFFNCRSVQKDTRIHWKEVFARPRRLQFPLCLVNSGLFWCLDLWNLWDLWAKGSWCHYFQQPMRGKNLICIHSERPCSDPRRVLLLTTIFFPLIFMKFLA